MLCLIIAISCASHCSSASNRTCPTWTYSSGDGWCTCGSSLSGKIICNNDTQDVCILSEFCLTTSDKDTDQAVVGNCLFQGNHGEPADSISGLYVRVSQNLSQQQYQLCDYLNRHRQLCGECKSNYFVSAYSYDLKCYQCHTGLMTNVVLYLTVAFLPLTLFLVGVLVLHVSVTSPRANTVILIFQIYSLPEAVKVAIQYTRGTNFDFLIRLIAALYGVWNLDFFRTLLPPICLPLSTMQLIGLDYLVAAYPLLLLVCLYVLVTAHNRGCGLVLRLFRPFLWCSARIRQQSNIRHSIIDALVTFILLSYIKFISTSITLLTPAKIYNVTGSYVGTLLFYDATVEFMGPRHRPYALLAAVVLAVVFMFPLLLVLYPMKWFQVFLNKCNMNSPSLRIFMECLQGYYRDKTDGGWDCRYFAAIYPTLRIGGCILYALTHETIFNSTISMVMIFLTALIVIIAPYKEQYKIQNKLDVLLIISIIGFCASQKIFYYSSDMYPIKHLLSIILLITFVHFPLIYVIILLLKKLIDYIGTVKNGRDTEDLNMSQPLLYSVNS